MKRILVTGRGTGGSWAVRGEQLGRAIGAHVQAQARDVGGFDLAVLVKRPTPDILQRLHRMDVPIVWDVVDAFPQPMGNHWGREQCMAWLRQTVQDIRPAAIVAATQAMADDCAEFGVPVRWVPHHAWPGQGSTVIAPEVRKVGYQGGANYLGAWGPFMAAECKRRGWRWIVNPPTVAELDIVVAVRNADGYAARKWKSNVKLANAQGAGTPFIGNREAGYMETAFGGERWADTEAEMARAMDSLTAHSARLKASAALASAAPRLEDIAKDYREWLNCR